jgi:hypothetical protein
MSPENLNDLASALGQLRPVAGVDRDALMFAAGQASAPTSWKWPLAAGISSLLALSLGLVLLLRPSPPPVIQFIYVRVQDPPPIVPPPGPPPSPEPTGTVPAALLQSNESDLPYNRLQDQLFRWGLDAMPALVHTEPSRHPVSIDALLKSLGEDNLSPK